MQAKLLKVLLIVTVTTGLAFLLTLVMPKSYTASVGIMVDPVMRAAERDQPFSAYDDLTNSTRGRSVQTEMDKIVGTDVLLLAIQNTQQSLPGKLTGQNASETYSMLVRRMRLDAQKDSDIVTVRVTLNDPELAAEVANQIGFAYLEQNRGTANDIGGRVLARLKEQAEVLREKLESADARLAEAKSRSGVIDLGTGANMIARNAMDLEQQRNALQAAYAGAVTELAAARQILRSMPMRHVNAERIQYDPELQELEVQITRLEIERQSALTHYLDDALPVREMDNRLRELRRQRDRIVRRGSDKSMAKDSSLNMNYMQQQAQVAQLEGRIAAIRGQMETVNRTLANANYDVQTYAQNEAELVQLLRERQVLEGNYQQLLMRQDMLEAQGSSRQPNARIISTALVPNQPSNPNVRLYVLFGAAMGVALSLFVLMPRQTPEVDYLLVPAPPVAGADDLPQLRPGGGEGRSSIRPVDPDQPQQ
jgi:polysaccharide biosynthesis transport protein